PAGGHDGWADHRGQPAGPGEHVHAHGPVRAPAAAAGAGRRRPAARVPRAGPARRPAGTRGGRQRHQPPHPRGVAARLADGAGDEPVAQPTPIRETAPAPATPPLHILVAEDNEFSARLLEQLLIRRGHRVRLAADGREALALASGGAYDLLLLDVHMPELDGFE